MCASALTHKQLADGSDVWLRTIRPEDRDLLAQGFAEFGEDSRYRRFLMRKDVLTDADLTYLTQVDGVRHQAVGAVARSEDGQQMPLGVARYVMFEGDPEVAEAAIAVIDAMQGKGLGKLLIHALGEVAYANGVRRFRCSVLAENEASHKVLLELDPNARVVHSEANVEELEIELPDPSARSTEPRSLLDRLLRLAAERTIAVRGLKRYGATAEPGDAPAHGDGPSPSELPEVDEQSPAHAAQENPKARAR